LPELPEIEHLKRSLAPILIGADVRSVRLRRPDVLRPAPAGRGPRRTSGRALLAGGRIDRLDRRGKQLALIADDGRLVCIHLGMSGELRFLEPRERLSDARHVHCTWTIDSPRGPGRLVFRDPRRFGGLWTFPSADELDRQRWSGLGPDALTIRAPVLAARTAGTRRAIKSALLDQRLIAGVGNIYADEALFGARIHPLRRADKLARTETGRLASALRGVMRCAVAAGGSTLRDYVDGRGRRGGFALRHRVYGRAGEPCVRCRAPLIGIEVGGRTTVYCPSCQEV